MTNLNFSAKTFANDLSHTLSAQSAFSLTHASKSDFTDLEIFDFKINVVEVTTM
jgi:hypothetical protein